MYAIHSVTNVGGAHFVVSVHNVPTMLVPYLPDNGRLRPLFQLVSFTVEFVATALARSFRVCMKHSSVFRFYEKMHSVTGLAVTELKHLEHHMLQVGPLSCSRIAINDGLSYTLNPL